MKNLVFHCVVCGDPIAPSRVTRKAVTCSDQHAKDLKNARRLLRDLTRCRLCNRPSTPEERKLFAIWRKQYNRTNGVKPGWKTGNKRGPRKKPADSGPTPIEQSLGQINV